MSEVTPAAPLRKASSDEAAEKKRQAIPPPPVRKPSLDEAAHLLEVLLKKRPEAQDLGVGILKAPPGSHSVDPSMHSKALKLAQRLREDELNKLLKKRPDPESLIKRGILPSPTSADGSQSDMLSPISADESHTTDTHSPTSPTSPEEAQSA